MATKPLIVGYGGTLSYKTPLTNSFLQKIKNIFWTYSNQNIDSSTRSGHFLIKAVKILKEQKGVKPIDLQIYLWGNISKYHIELIEKEQVEEFFKIEGALPYLESLKKLEDVDLFFLPLEKSASHCHRTLFIPGKLYEYMEHKKPIFALCEESDCKDIILKSGLGLFALPDNPNDISTKLFEILETKALLSDIKVNENFISSFSFKSKSKELSLILKELN